MSDTPWCAVFAPGVNAWVTTSREKIERVLADHPYAQVSWFHCAAEGWSWVRSKYMSHKAKVGKNRLESSKKARPSACAPRVPSNQLPSRIAGSPSRRSARQTVRRPLSEVAGFRVPGSFPEEPTSAERHGADLESDYGYDDFALDDPSIAAWDDFYTTSVPGPSRSNADHNTNTEKDGTGSTSSYEEDYPLKDLPRGDELCYYDMPTPPPSSPIRSQTLSSSPLLPSPHSRTIWGASSHRDWLEPSSSATACWSSSLTSLSTAPPAEPLTPPPRGSESYANTKIALSPEQQGVLQKVMAGESIFFTGSAGTGKSLLLREIITFLRANPGKHVDVTASTGIAALNIGGRTLHSFAGVGLGKQPTYILIKRVQNNERVRDRWRDAKTLVIDEISMVDGDWFDALEAIARAIRGSNAPFGGIQLVLCGDFFQLPPVEEQRVDIFAPVKRAKFAFEASSWHRCVPTQVTLTQIFRQKDTRLIRLLDEMRVGMISDETCELFSSLSRPLTFSDGIIPTELYPKRWSVELSNKRRLELLPGDLVTLAAKDRFLYDEQNRKITPERGRAILDKIAPRSVQLKIGAQVMCTKNLGGPARLVNGSIGKVVDFMIPIEARDSQKTVREETSHYPYTSILGDLEPDRTLDPATLQKSPGTLHHQYEMTKWPVVEYIGGYRILMGPVEFTSERLTDGETQASRHQVPLILAWAMTIHKSQGQTLDRVKIDLRGTFETGQAYVALSRCTSLEGLEVYNFHSGVVMANPRVMRWSGLATSYLDSNSLWHNSSPKEHSQQIRSWENHYESLRTPLKRRVTNTQWSDDDEESIAIRMYHSP